MPRLSILLCCLLYLTLSTVPSAKQVHAWPIRVTAGTQVKSNSNSNLRIVTKCFPGMYLKIDCKMYFDCSKEGHFRRSFCDIGTYWNHRDKKCDEIQNVPECVAVYSANPENRAKAAVQQQLLNSVSSTVSPNKTDKKASPFVTFAAASTTTTIKPSSAFVSTSASAKKATTQSTAVLGSTQQTKINQLKGEDDDYVDPPNIDWDIDGVLGLESGTGGLDISEKTGNDIITEDAKQDKGVIKKENPLEAIKEDNEAPVLPPSTSSDTQGKICVLRGKEKVCTPAVNSIPAVYTNQIFSQQVSSTVSPSTDSTTFNSNSTIRNSVEKVNLTNPISFNITIHLGVQESAINFVRIIAYYVNFTLIAWKTT